MCIYFPKKQLPRFVPSTVSTALPLFILLFTHIVCLHRMSIMTPSLWDQFTVLGCYTFRQRKERKNLKYLCHLISSSHTNPYICYSVDLNVIN